MSEPARPDLSGSAEPGPATGSAVGGGQLSALAAALAETLAASRTQQVSLDVVWRAAVAFDRSLASAPHAAAELDAALAELQAARVATLPRDRAQYDRRSVPALPLWVRRPARPAAARPTGPGRVWPSALQGAGAVATRPDELELLETVTAFLRAGGAARRSVPVRERSLELFGDEKRLDKLVGSRLFTTGTLTLDLLRCHTVPMPFAAQWVPGAPTSEVVLIVAENHHTYASLLTAAREQAAAGGPGRYVGYGAGGQFRSGVASIVLLDPRPTRIVYFGDIDLHGLLIPAEAASTARAGGLPDVEPASGLYEVLLSVGRRAPNPPVPAAAAAAAEWLGRHAAAAAELLVAGQRVAQEAVGLELLTARPDVLRDL